MSTLKFSKKPQVQPQNQNVDDIAQDALALFTNAKQGHMERWEYGPSLFEHDPAGGGDHWAALVKNPGNYYLTEGDTETIKWSLEHPQMSDLLSEVETVVELGPGSEDSINNKTIPFLNACPQLENYIAIDATLEQASEAARNVQQSLSITTGVRNQDYMNTPLVKAGKNKTAIVMWGSSLGNIDGLGGDNPFQKLIRILDNFTSGLKKGDLIVLCFDTETNSQKVISAYSEPNLQAQVLSVLFRLQRDSYISGNFDPRLWQHKPSWHEESYQCAHMIYPIADQNFQIEGEEIIVPAWTRFISNNSYKFKPETIERAAFLSGLKSLACFQKGPIALLVAEKT